MKKDIIKEMVQYMRDQGIIVTYDDNPSEEKLERIRKRIKELEKRNK